MSEPAVTFTRYSPKNPAPAPSQTATIVLTRPAMSPEEYERASLLTKAKRLGTALREWHAAGLPLASRAVRQARLGKCKACDLFDLKGNWGLGECRHGTCGCSKIKAALETSKCPIGRWDA